MTVREFTDAILTLGLEFEFAVTSWGRGSRRNAAVGGVPASYHLSFRAVDVILEADVNRDAFIRRAEYLGLEVIVESDHLHVEPS